MQIGVIYPQTELRGDPEAVRQFALAAERLGYQHISAYDHVVGASHDDRDPPLWGPYTEADPFHDPFVLFAYLAGITKLDFATDVMILPQRQTVLVAKQAADLDLLSGGRFRLGVGTGWNYVEYEALGYDFASRRPPRRADRLPAAPVDRVDDRVGGSVRSHQPRVDPAQAEPIDPDLGRRVQ